MSTEKELQELIGLVADFGEECIRAGLAHVVSCSEARNTISDDVRRTRDAITTRLRALLSELEVAREDVKRVQYMQENYIGADFKYGEPACEVIVIEMPKGSSVCGDLRIDIDAARKEQK